MKQFTLFVALMLLQFQDAQAQYLKYMGLRAEFASISANSSEEATINKPISIGAGVSFHYPFSPTWEMTVGGLVSFYKLTGDTRDYSASSSKWTPGGSKSLSTLSFDFDYTVLHGFGDAQHFKLGVGAFYSIFQASKPTLNTDTESWGTNAALAKNYQLLYLGKAPNAGVLIEGLYNVNDALQFSLRYKLGLTNLYDTDMARSTATWKQNALGLSVIYYFGAEERGSKKSSKGKAKKKVNF